MINVNQITSQLARMPDQALQQYAQMHKADPYVLSLALSESNRRKQMRQGSQMSVPEQPKVVDQELQGMAAPMPEDVGIAQLPAGDMNFAEGGIVAFSDGGDVPRYQSGGMLDAARARAQAAQQKLYTYGLRQRQQDPTGFQAAQQELAAAQTALQSAEQKYAAEMSASGANRAAFGASAAFAPEAATASPPVDATARLSAGDRALRQQPVAVPSPTADKGSRVPPSGGPGPAAPSAPAPAAGLAALQNPAQMYQNALENTPLVDPTAGQRETLGKEMVGGAQQRLTERQAEIEKEGDLFKGRGERISKREEALGKNREQITGLAFLEAGLAVMSTPGGLATALGKGARVGTERFASGLDKLRAAQERLEDAKDNLETLRLNRSDMNAKDIRAMKSDIDRAKLDAQKLAIEGTALAAGERSKRAGEIFKVTAEQELTQHKVGAERELAQLRESGANQRQQTASAATVQAAKVAAQQKVGRSDDELREIYAKSVVLQSRYPNVNDYLTMMKGTAALQSGQQLNPADAALVNKYLR